MMGSPFYYDVLYDYGPGDVVFHDCMWSGVCTCCIQLVHQDAHYQRSIDESPADIHVTVKALNPEMVPTKLEPREKKKKNPTTCDNRKLRSRASVKLTSTSKSTYTTTLTTSGSASTTAVATSTTFEGKKLRHHQRESAVPTTTSADNKKLRHREVEKNRHRQLQAMVKTLSERIPGRMDKETQVQTMKRAARYCVFLRDILTAAAAASAGQTSSTLTKDKLEKIYHQSCDNVNLIMSQQ